MSETPSSMEPNAMKNRALQIVRMAKTDQYRAAQLAHSLVSDLAPQLGIENVVLNDSKLSLNSVNGTMNSANKKYFFKFHAEEGEKESLKDSEYYNAELLATNGWPMVRPIFSNSTPGSQLVVYDHVNVPTAFELYEKAENGELQPEETERLLAAEREFCSTVSACFLRTLETSSRDEINGASLNQLFYRRLVSPDTSPARLQTYYEQGTVTLPGGEGMAFKDFTRLPWVINGVRYEDPLKAIITRTKGALDPYKERNAATVIGHGDDHNGNRFLIDGRFVLFDPAFGGRQPALLSFIKATAHNVFLHPQWLYEPQKLAGKLRLTVNLEDDALTVTHNWDELPKIRQDVLAIYAKEVWQPLLQMMSDKKMLPPYWRAYIRSALFACPFLVLNLIDPKRYTPEQSILALSKCVELGSKGNKETIVDRFLDSIQPV